MSVEEPEFVIKVIAGRSYRVAAIRPAFAQNYLPISGSKQLGKRQSAGKMGKKSSKGENNYLVRTLKRPFVYYDPSFLSSGESEQYLQELRGLKWDKTERTNRFTVLHGDDNASYFYPDQPSLVVHPWLPSLMAIRRKVEQWYLANTGRNVNFNICLANYYKDGQQSIGWHADREEIGRTTPIASVSLGSERIFKFRANEDPTDKGQIRLATGSLLVMENECQTHYAHCLPRDNSIKGDRVNLTFRSKTDGIIQPPPRQDSYEDDDQEHAESMKQEDEGEGSDDEVVGVNERATASVVDIRKWVVHVRKGQYDVYVGRPNPEVDLKGQEGFKWGNPFKIGDQGMDRAAVIRKYEEWINLPQQRQLREEAKVELKGKVLACWCAPEACHAEVLARIANGVAKERGLDLDEGGDVDYMDEPSCKLDRSLGPFAVRGSAARGPQGEEDEEGADVDMELEQEETVHIVQEGETRFSCRLPLETGSVGAVLGKGGENVRQIQRDTSTTIELAKQGGQEGTEQLWIRGSTRQAVQAAVRRVRILAATSTSKAGPVKGPYTHFISVSVKSDRIRAKFASFVEQAVATKSTGIEPSIFVNPDLLHVTCLVLRLPDDLEQKAVEVLKGAESELRKLTQTGSKKGKAKPNKGFPLRLKGLHIMNDDPAKTDVLYMHVENDAGLEILQKATLLLCHRFANAGLLPPEEVIAQRLDAHNSATLPSDHHALGTKFHVTLANSKLRKTGAEDAKRVSFDSREVLKRYGGTEFGAVEIGSLHLSKIATTRGDSGDTLQYSHVHSVSV